MSDLQENMEIVTIKISESDIKTYRYDEETITTKDEIDEFIKELEIEIKKLDFRR